MSNMRKDGLILIILICVVIGGAELYGILKETKPDIKKASTFTVVGIESIKNDENCSYKIELNDKLVISVTDKAGKFSVGDTLVLSKGKK